MLDLGCGDGSLTVEMGRFAERVIGVDYNPELLASARQRMDRLGLEHVTLLAEDVGSLSLEPQSVDVAVFSQSLHHLDDPFSGIRQAYRLLRPGGLLAVMELAAHDQLWVLEKLKHKWPGFEQEHLAEDDAGSRICDTQRGNPSTMMQGEKAFPELFWRWEFGISAIGFVKQRPIVAGTMDRKEILSENLLKKLDEEIVLLDGATSTMIQQHKPRREDFRNEALARSSKSALQGINDLLSITRPGNDRKIHTGLP